MQVLSSVSVLRTTSIHSLLGNLRATVWSILHASQVTPWLSLNRLVVHKKSLVAAVDVREKLPVYSIVLVLTKIVLSLGAHALVRS